jgi:hypothetical protein
MTTYTETELATQTLRAPGLVGIEETLSAAEYVDVVQSNRSVIATMGAIGLPIWNGSELSVPEEYFVELALRLSLPIQMANGLIDHRTMLSMIEASEARLTVMAAPRGAMPLLAQSNDSTRGRVNFNWTTG